MCKEIYKRYFDKDKSLRHYSQHLIIAIGTLIFFYLFVFEEITLFNIITFFLFTYLIDLDGILTVFLFKRYSSFRQNITKLLRSGKFREAAEYATKNHKKISHLLLHNLFFYFLFSALLLITIYNDLYSWAYIFLAIVTHMTFDILDDIKNLGHIKHWTRIK